MILFSTEKETFYSDTNRLCNSPGIMCNSLQWWLITHKHSPVFLAIDLKQYNTSIAHNVAQRGGGSPIHEDRIDRALSNLM